MKLIWYLFVKLYVTIGFAFYYKKIDVHGLDNIPKNKAVMFISNHPNALIDPLITAITNKRNTHYLTQAGVFTNAFVKKLLFSVNMIPVYRVRDGMGSKKLKSANEEIFKYCYELLNKKKALLIFPEGSHNIQRRIRPFRKGFARIVFGALDQNTNLEVVVIPVGVNYSKADAYASKVSIYYGKEIAVNPLWKLQDRNEAIKKLLVLSSEQLKLLTTHIDDIDHYDEIENQFEQDDFLFPEMVNKKIKTLDHNPIKKIRKKSEKRFNLLLLLVKINSIFPFLIWKRLRPKIKQIEYLATFKYAIGITAFPIFYFLQTWVIAYFFGATIGFIYLFISFLSVYILTKTKTVT